MITKPKSLSDLVLTAKRGNNEELAYYEEAKVKACLGRIKYRLSKEISPHHYLTYILPVINEETGERLK